MGDIFTNLKRTFKEGSVLAKLIYINAGLFILLRISIELFKLFNINADTVLTYLSLPSAWDKFIYHPWTLITYMFTHLNLLHILFNMLWLYWFGKYFLNFFNSRQLGGLYILGGIAGGVLFMISYNVFPYFEPFVAGATLIGASAAVMAIVFAISFYKKDLEIHLLLIGRIKLIYLALFVLIIDMFAVTSTNAGGHIAHLGGAFLGIFFASRMRKGKDITAPMNRLLDKIVNLGKRKPKMRVTHKRAETDYEYNARKNRDMAELDKILDKLKRSGYNSLSSDEKKKLFDAGKK